MKTVLPPGSLTVARGYLLDNGGDQGLVHHVVHDGSRRVVGSGLLAGALLGLRVVGGQQVLEDLTQQLRVQGHFHLYRGVLLDGELVVVEQINEAVRPKEEAVRNGEQPLVHVGEAVDAVAALTFGLLAVEAVEKSAIDEGGLREVGAQCVGVRHLVTEAVAGEVPVGRVGLAAELPSANFRVQGGEEEVL